MSGFESYFYTYEEDSWVESGKVITTKFDDKDRPLECIDSVFNEDGYYADAIFIYTYNESGLFSSVSYGSKVQDESEEKWNINYKKYYTYNEDGKIIKEVTSFYYEEEEMDWVSESADYYYDEHGNLIKIIYTYEDGEIEEISFTNFYSSGSNANEVFLSVKSNIYPNPASDVLNVTIEGADNAVITLVNAAGSIVVQQKTSNLVTSIPVRFFSKGYYFLTVKTSKGTKTHKVIIR